MQKYPFHLWLTYVVRLTRTLKGSEGPHTFPTLRCRRSGTGRKLARVKNLHLIIFKVFHILCQTNMSLKPCCSRQKGQQNTTVVIWPRSHFQKQMPWVKVQLRMRWMEHNESFCVIWHRRERSTRLTRLRWIVFSVTAHSDKACRKTSVQMLVWPVCGYPPKFTSKEGTERKGDRRVEVAG